MSRHAEPNAVLKKRRLVREKTNEKGQEKGFRVKDQAVAENDKFIELFLKDPNYQVTKEGKILTQRDRAGHIRQGEWREFSIDLGQDGHASIRYRKRKMDKSLSVPRLVYRAFLGPLDATKVIGHRDGNVRNNHMDNLILETRAKNNLKQYREFGRKGVKGNTKINQVMADTLRKLHKKGWSYKRLCERFKLSKSTVCYAVKGLTWNDNKKPVQDFSPAKLSIDQARAIRAERQKGRPYKKIALDFGVGKTTVIDIVKNRIYREDNP